VRERDNEHRYWRYASTRRWVTMFYPDDFERLTVLSAALGGWLAGLLHLRGRTAVHSHVSDVDNLRRGR
jgi:hypothetical protein